MAKGFLVVLVLLTALYISFGGFSSSLSNEAITGMMVYSDGYFLNWSDTKKITSADNNPANLFGNEKDNSAVFLWNSDSNDMQSAYADDGVVSAVSTLASGNSRNAFMDKGKIVWVSNSDGTYRVYQALLSSSKDSLESQSLVSDANATYCFVNLSGVCTNNGSYAIDLDVEWSGGNYSKLWGNLTGYDIGFLDDEFSESPYSHQLTDVNINNESDRLDMAAMVYNDNGGGAVLVCKSEPDTLWFSCDADDLGSEQHAFTKDTNTEASDAVVYLYKNDTYIFWVEKREGKYGLYYTKILSNNTKQFDNRIIYDSMNLFELASVVINNDQIRLFVFDSSNLNILTLGINENTALLDSSVSSATMDRGDAVLFNGDINYLYKDSSGLHHKSGSGTILLDGNGIDSALAVSDELLFMAWRWANGRLFYKIVNVNNTEIYSGEIEGAHATGGVSAVSAGNGFHLAWIDNTDGFDKIFYKYLDVSGTGQTCSASISAVCSHLTANNYTVQATVQWSGGNYSRLGGNLTGMDSSFSYSSINFTTSPYSYAFNISDYNATASNFNISLNAFVFVQNEGSSVLSCQSNMPDYWLMCRKPVYKTTSYNLSHSSSDIRQTLNTLQTHMNAMLSATMSNSTLNNVASESHLLENFIDVGRIINISSDGVSKVMLGIHFNGSHNITNFFIYDVIPKTFAVHDNFISIDADGRERIVKSDPEYMFLYDNVYPNQSIVITYTASHYSNVSMDDFSEPYVYAVSYLPSSSTTTIQTNATANTTSSTTTSSTTTSVYEYESTIDYGGYSNETGGQDNGGLILLVIILAVIAGAGFFFRKKIMFFIKYLTA